MKNERMIQLRGDRSKREIARTLGIPYSTYAMIEDGRRFPRKQLMTTIADFYGETVYSLFFAQHGHETRPADMSA